jgi:Holliday junction resolvase RusA-like endonuclease
MPSITVYDHPVPKARPRFARGKDGRMHTFTPRSTELAEHRIREAWLEAHESKGPITEPAALYVLVVLPRPAGHFGRRGLLPSAPRYPGKKPDLDNYVKTVLDALAHVALQDDALVVNLEAVKRYAEDSSPPRWEIEIAPIAFLAAGQPAPAEDTRPGAAARDQAAVGAGGPAR